MKAVDLVAVSSLATLRSTAAITQLLITPTGYILIFVSGGLAVGSLSVAFLETLERNRSVYISTLWALVLCLLISLWLGSQLPLAGLGLVQLTQGHGISAALGIFWRGKRYWR